MNKTPKILLESKRAQAKIGKTLTWIIAIVIISFVMLGFIIATGILSGKKLLLDRNIIGLDEEQDLDSLYSQRTLIRILNTFVDEEKTIKDLIFEWQLSKDEFVKRKIVDEVGNILGNDENINYYFFKVISDEGDYLSVGGGRLDSSKKFVELNLFLNEQKINVGLAVDKEETKEDVERRNKDTVVIHYSVTDSAKGTESVLKKRGLSVHYILERDGTILECEIDNRKIKKCLIRKDVSEVEGKWEDRVALHTGCGVDPDKESPRPYCYNEKERPKPDEYEQDVDCCRRGFNGRSVGIEIVNVGYLCKENCEEKIINVCGEEFEYKYWEKYTEEQMDALVDLVSGIVSRNDILINREYIIGHDEIDSCRKKDPGPAFPWEEFIEDLKSEEEI